MIDIILLIVIALVTWCVAGEGPWGAAFSLIIVIFSGLLAMNFFEPLAAFLQANVAGSYEWQNRWDLIALLGIFAGAVFLLKEATVRILPVDIPVHPMAFDVGRWALGVATGYVTMAFLLAALHTAPLPREFMGFAPERANLLNIVAPDRQWLGFTQYVSERGFDGGVTSPTFDGAEFPRIPDKPETLQVWSSFPIRYAMRREQYASMGAAAAGAATSPGGGGGAAPPPTQPRPGRGPSSAF